MNLKISLARYLVIGLGADRRDTFSLFMTINQIPDSFFVHEGFMLPWYGTKEEALNKISEFLNSTQKKYVGDVGFYWLPYVETVIKNIPDVKFICLKRDKKQTVKSFMKKTEGRNHWINHDGKKWKKDYVWDRCFPKYEVESKEQALKLYWEEYYNKAILLEKKYPKNFKIFDITVLNSEESFKKVLDFIGVSHCKIIPKKENVLLSKEKNREIETSLLKRIKIRWFEEKKFLPWRLEQKIAYRGGILNTLILSPIRKTITLKKAIKNTKGNDITVVLPIRDIEPFRLWHSLASIYNQQYNFGKIYVLVIDYGSSFEKIKEILDIVNFFGYKYIYLNKINEVWSKSKALNIGIRNTRTTFVVSTDVDVIFSPFYFQKAIFSLKKEPFSVIYSYCLDLPEELNAKFIELYKKKDFIDIFSIKKNAIKRWDSQPSYGINITYKFYYDVISGYDEFFKGWGCEDDDLYRRFFLLGLNPKVIFDENVFYCHIWHEKWGGLLTEDKVKQIEENRKYILSIKSIKRNDKFWGIV